MVGHGRDRKRRAGRIGKVKLKTYRTWKRWDPNPKFTDKRIKKNWDTNISPSANLVQMGLVALPNDLNNSRGSSTKVTVTQSTPIELFDIPESDRPSLRSRYPLDEEEEKYIAKCMKKHGDNYLKMFRDTKTNDMQHTEQVLRKLGSRYLLLSPQQRRVEVPENVKPLLPGGAAAAEEEEE
eukprot:CAMPEP_0172443924 /NCGR_PEP_ID=MMETSP1065-20121228/4100_1 /TAXON_ID=265537 /ORGANISM="Amphiprora paludosa, Strain CCMP125" /LENGTH=180 /DNA_ID=CAMNT_0013194319 /DNA_START=44 /DNA_END=586 /DNA_ORIENTATION=-